MIELGLKERHRARSSKWKREKQKAPNKAPDEKLSLVCQHIHLAEMKGLIASAIQVSGTGPLMGSGCSGLGQRVRHLLARVPEVSLSHIANTFLGDFMELLCKQFVHGSNG